MSNVVFWGREKNRSIPSEQRQPCSLELKCLDICRLGAHYRKGNVGTEQDFSVERIINHHSYQRPKGMAHDISLLKLSRPAQLKRTVNLACLPGSSESVPDGKMCWVTGKLKFRINKKFVGVFS